MATEMLSPLEMDMKTLEDYKPSGIVGMEAPRLNEGKAKMKYWLMFPHAAKAICESLEKNEDKYPNDGFGHYVPQETASSLIRHMFDAMAPDQVHNPDELQRDHLVALAFNALCLLENCISQDYEFPTTGRCL